MLDLMNVQLTFSEFHLEIAKPSVSREQANQIKSDFIAWLSLMCPVEKA